MATYEFTQLNALLVDPDMDSRSRFRHATTSVTDFNKIVQVGTVKEAASKLSATHDIDVVFFSHRLGTEEVNNYIQEAKSTPIGEGRTYIFIEKPVDENISVAGNLMYGDGILFEPYSVEGLVEIVEIANRVKNIHQQKRQEAARTLILTDAMKLVSEIAKTQKLGRDVKRQVKKFTEICSELKGVSADGIEFYEKTIKDVFMNAVIPTPVASLQNYGGVSARVQKRLEALSNKNTDE